MQPQVSKIHWRSLLEIVAAIAGILGFFVAIGQWLVPNTTVKAIIGLVTIKIALVIILVIITCLFISILFRLLAKPRKIILWAIIGLYIVTIAYSIFLGSLNNTSTSIIFSLDQANTRLYTYNGAQISHLDNHAIKLLGYWDQAAWIDQDLPDNFRATIIAKTDSATSLNIGLGDGSNNNPAILFVCGTDGGSYFVKWDKDTWNRLTTPLTDTVDTIRSSTRYIIILERRNNILKVTLNGSDLIDNVHMPVETRGFNHLYLTTNLNVNNENKVGATIIENITIERTD